MRITRLGVVCVAVALQAACLSTTVSDDAQALAQLQQDKARLNRVYASVEASLLEIQRSDAAMQYARQQLAELQLARLKTCTSPASPNTQLRLQYAKCQYQATLSDLDKLQQWQKVRYQFSAKTAKTASK
ncbi:MAG TPA: hypothetical protein PK856_07270 [Vitreoscilla sp.]|nr:hypothetical protein [Vitreoscilla sp.]